MVALPSGLHEKVKFILGNRLIFFMAKEDLSVPALIMVPFIDAHQVDHDTRYNSLYQLMRYLRVKCSKA